MARKVCVIKGDDASPEVVLPTVDILEHVKLVIDFLWPPTGQEAMDKYGHGFPPEATQLVDSADCTLFGSASRFTGGALRYLRWGRKTYANLRPVKWVKGFWSPLKYPEGIDLVIVRENLEGLYPSREGDLADLAPLAFVNGMTGSLLDTSMKGKYAVRVITEENTRNICEAACELALKRKAAGGRGKVTVAAKYNMLAQSDGLFRKIAEDTVARYPDLTFEQLIIDNFGHQMIIDPHQFDVIVMPNEYGDVMADAAAALVGGLGLAPSACVGKDYAYFAPVHGTAPDIAGKNIINPTAMILSARMMLDYLGLEEQGETLQNAVYQVYAEGKHLTRDMGGESSTVDFCEAVKARL